MTDYTKEKYIEKLSDRLSISKNLLSKFSQDELKGYFNRSANSTIVTELHVGSLVLIAASATAFGVGLPIALPILLGGASAAAMFGHSYLRSGNERVTQDITARAGHVLPALPAPGK